MVIGEKKRAVFLVEGRVCNHFASHGKKKKDFLATLMSTVKTCMIKKQTYVHS